MRIPNGNEHCIGTLLGYLEGSTLIISDAFVVLHKESEAGFSLDKEYHKRMVTLSKKIVPTESVVGWFCTGDDISPSWVVVHNFYANSAESRFTPSNILPSPVLLNLDPTLSAETMGLRVYVMQQTPGAETLAQFNEIKIESNIDSFAGVSHVCEFLASKSVITGDQSESSLENDLKAVRDWTGSDAQIDRDLTVSLDHLNYHSKSVHVATLEAQIEKQKELISKVSNSIQNSDNIII